MFSSLTGDEPNATYENFVEDIVALQQIAKNFADVNPEDIVGMRAPYLKTEGDGRSSVPIDLSPFFSSTFLTERNYWRVRLFSEGFSEKSIMRIN